MIEVVHSEKNPENPKGGDLFYNEVDPDTLYILVSPCSGYLWCFISIKNGSRWTDPCQIDKIFGKSSCVWKKFTGKVTICK